VTSRYSSRALDNRYSSRTRRGGLAGGSGAAAGAGAGVTAGARVGIGRVRFGLLELPCPCHLPLPGRPATEIPTRTPCQAGPRSTRASCHCRLASLACVPQQLSTRSLAPDASLTAAPPLPIPALPSLPCPALSVPPQVVLPAWARTPQEFVRRQVTYLGLGLGRSSCGGR
jgi:hypothetical protein